jgi:hypothetical protein
MLMPGTSLVIGGGKEGVMYALDKTNLGGPQPPVAIGHLGGAQIGGASILEKPCHPQPAPPVAVQVFQAAALFSKPPFSPNPLDSIVDFVSTTMGYHHIHGSPVVFDDGERVLAYVWAERDHLRAFRFDPAQGTRGEFVDVAQPGQPPRSAPTGPMNDHYGMPGAALSISAAGKADGILWAALPRRGNALTHVVPGVLRAFSASTLEPLWDSFVDGHVLDYWFAKYCAPTVVAGKVFVATFSEHGNRKGSGRLDVYGLK